MTNGELIAMLQQWPADTPVKVFDWHTLTSEEPKVTRYLMGELVNYPVAHIDISPVCQPNDERQSDFIFGKEILNG